MAELAGRKLGEFEVLSKVGEGGMGAVYLGRQASLGRQVAIKILAPALAANARFVERFHHEAAAAAQLTHQNIVQVYTAGEQDGVHYIAMEYVPGKSLREKIERHGQLTPTESIAICVHVVNALQYAWERAQIIHRDIKPDNILISNHGDVKVADLGLAKQFGEAATGVTMSGVVMGSPHFISPEQARSARTADFRADIYSLGCTLYHMLAGRPPYPGEEMMEIMLQHINDPMPDIRQVVPDCPAAVVALLNKMLDKNRDRRHASYDELLAELMSAHEHLAVQANIPTVPGMPSRIPLSPTAVTIASEPAMPSPKKSRTLVYVLAGAIALAAIGAAVFLAAMNPKRAALESALSAPPDPTPAKPASVAKSPEPKDSSAVDLLTTVDVKRDAVRGLWTMTPEGLVLAQSQGLQMLGFDYVAPEEYDFEIEFTIAGGTREVFQLLPVPGGFIRWRMGAGHSDPTPFGFGLNLDGIRMDTPARTEAVVTRPRLQAGQRYRCVVEVRKGSLRALLDGAEVVKWSGDLKRFGPDDLYRLPDPKRPGLASNDTGVTFHKAELRPVVAGSAAPPAANAEGWVNLLAQVDLKRDVLLGDWEWQNGELYSQDDGISHRTIELPVANPPAEYDIRYRITRRIAGAAMFFAVRSGDAWAGLIMDSWTSNPERREEVSAVIGDPLKPGGGVQVINPERYFTVGATHEVIIQVRNDRVTVFFDGKELLNHRGGLASMADRRDMAFLTPAYQSRAFFGVGICGGEAVVNSIELKPVAAVATTTPRDAVKWLVANGGNCVVGGAQGEVEVKTEQDIPASDIEVVHLALDRYGSNRPPPTDADFQVFNGIKTLRRVYVRTPGLTDRAFVFLAGNPELTFINFELIAELTDDVLLHVAGARKISTFHLSNAPGFAGKNLAEMAWLQTVTDVDFLGTSVGDDALKALGSCPNLNFLRIASDRAAATDAGLAALAAAPNLTILALHYCPRFTDAGLSNLRGLKSLKNLNADSTAFGDQAAAALTNSAQIEILSLSNTALTDAGLAKLSGLSRLKTLNVRGSKVTAEGVAAFRNAHPNCQVMF